MLQNWIAITIGLILGLVSLLITLWPIVNPKNKKYSSKQDVISTQHALRTQRLSIYTQIAKLNKDKTDKLITETEWQRRLAKLKLSAASILKIEEKLGTDTSQRAQLLESIQAEQDKEANRDATN